MRAPPLADLLRGAERLGGKYLVTGSVLPEANGLRLAAELYSVADGERLVRGVDTASEGSIDPAVGRLALQSIRTLADREQLDLGARKPMFSSTSSATALGQLIQGQANFWQGDYEAAATAFARAIEAGVLSINANTSVRVQTPFGGFKQSGFGRELGMHALDGYSEVKNVFISTES